MIYPTDHNALLAESDRVSALIAASRNALQVLESREAEINAFLDDYTRPQLAATPDLRIAPPEPPPLRRGFAYVGHFTRCNTFIDIYLRLLRRLWIDFPNQRRDMALAATTSRSYNRRYISQDRMNLFTGMTENWTIAHSTSIVDDWYVDINVNRNEIEKRLRRVLWPVGLKWDADVSVTWYSKRSS